MKYLLLSVPVLLIMSFMSCGNEISDSEEDDISETQALSISAVQKLDESIDSVALTTSPILRSARSRAMDDGDFDGLVLSQSDSLILKQETKSLLTSVCDMFTSINVSKDELMEIVDGDTTKIIALGLLCSSITHDKETATRANNGRPQYIQCLLESLGLDYYDIIQDAIKHGATKIVVKKMAKKVIVRFIAPAGAPLMAFLYWLCLVSDL